MYSIVQCNRFHQVKSNMYVSILVYTSIYWYGPVHTRHELVCTGTDQYIPVHTGIYLHKPLYDILTMYIPRSYAFVLVQSVVDQFKKSVRRTRTRDLLHAVCRILPCTTGYTPRHWNVDRSFFEYI
jgi:hypothetical protein